MYFPIRWPKFLKLDKNVNAKVVSVNSDYNRSLFAVLTEDSISIWLEKLCVQIVHQRRSQESLHKHGRNEKIVWRRDSSMVAVLTSMGYLLFYHLDTEDANQVLFEQIDSRIANLKRESAELFIKDKIYPLHVSFASDVHIAGEITSVLSFRDELLVGSASGCILRVGWDATIRNDLMLDIKQVSFSVDYHHASRQNLPADTFQVKDVQYLPLIGGLSVVFSSGKAAVLMANTSKFEPKDVHGVWIPDLNNATCTAVNHRYRLIAFGQKSGEGAVYHLDDITGTFLLSHRLALADKDFPDVTTVAGAVCSLQWTPDSAAVAVAWEKGGIALWSVFGSLLMCSLNWDTGSNISRKNLFKVYSMEWGAEGYHLWMVAASIGTPEDTDIALMNFVKSASTVNPGPQTGREHVLLQGADCVLISAKSDLADSALKRTSEEFSWNKPMDSNWYQHPLVGVNKHWIVELVPHTYLSTNWPVRYAAIDSDCCHVVVAGRGGLAHYSMLNKKWKFFGNETQEQDFIVTGGLLWWDSYIILGCVNLRDSRDEIRMYPRNTKLDNNFVRVTRASAQLLQMSLSEDKLLVFFADSHLILYHLQLRSSPSGSGIQLVQLQDIDISNLIPHCLCVVSATLTLLSVGTSPWPGKRPESILLNVCGRLMLLQQDPARRTAMSSSIQGIPQYSAPTVLASCVENVWISSQQINSMPHLTQALWIACGIHGMQVWLPLFPNDADKMRSHNFMSKRIMLPISVHIYPLAVLFREAVVLGAESDTAVCGNDMFPLCIVSKSSQVYLHPILRQLLCRNLGYHAWEIAHSCSNLPYFPHSLELLLHEVLEEEAMSSEPIPDALLPRVIDFIREFPVFLQTVVQCTRKTELALWPYLFAAVGNPKDLFQECLLQGQLETAASYLLVLQNLEVALVSRQHATLLLGAALDSGKWQLAKDLIRFLKAIDPLDVESPPRASLVIGPPNKCSVPYPTEDDLNMVLGSLPRSRLPSRTDPDTDQKPVSSSKSQVMAPREDSDTVNEVFIDVILSRHARKLLSAGHLKKLGSFSAHLEFSLETFFRKERIRAGKIEDYVHALKAVHQDFEWPYPINLPNFLGMTIGSLLPETNEIPSFGLNCDSKEDQKNGSLISDSGITDHTIDAHLQPQTNRDSESVCTSEDSSWWGEDSPATPDDDSQLAVQLKFMTEEFMAKGSPQSEMQIRYLLHKMIEAECHDWEFILQILLRDAQAVAHLTNTHSEFQSALQLIETWAQTECIGYKTFLQAVWPYLQTKPSEVSCQHEQSPAPSENSDEEVVVAFAAENERNVFQVAESKTFEAEEKPESEGGCRVA